MDETFDGQVAMVTGASSGVGRATCKVFAARGARVVAVARREILGKDLEQEIRDGGGEATFVAGDVSVVDDCRRAVETAIGQYGRLDFLVNNAAAHAPRSQILPSHTVTEEEWDVVVNTNLKGTFFCSRFALEHMTKQGSGVIINVSSKNGERATAGMSAYNSSKAGILHLSRTLAIEYLPYGIRVFGIVLGGVDTPMGREGGQALATVMYGPEGAPSDWGDVDLSSVTLSPDQVARALALLCTNDAEPFFESIIKIDGGASAAMESGGAFGGFDLAGALKRLADRDPAGGNT